MWSASADRDHARFILGVDSLSAHAGEAVKELIFGVLALTLLLHEVEVLVDGVEGLRVAVLIFECRGSRINVMHAGVCV